METFLKRSGIGAIVIITSPFWLALFLLYVVFGTLMIILTPLRGLFGLFSSSKGTFKIKNHYDVEAAKRIAENSPGNVSSPINQVPTYIYTNNPNNNNNNNGNNGYPTNPQQNYSNPNINNLRQNNNQNQQGYNNNNQQNHNNNQQNYNNNQSNNYDSNNYPYDDGQNGGCC